MIDLIQSKLEIIETRNGSIDRKFNSLDDDIENNFESRNEEIDSLLSSKADVTVFHEIDKKSRSGRHL